MFVILSHCILFSRVLIYSARCSGLFFACVYICYIYVIDNTSSPSSLLLSVQQIYTSLKLISKLHLRAPQSQSPPASARAGPGPWCTGPYPPSLSREGQTRVEFFTMHANSPLEDWVGMLLAQQIPHKSCVPSGVKYLGHRSTHFLKRFLTTTCTQTKQSLKMKKKMTCSLGTLLIPHGCTSSKVIGCHRPIQLSLFNRFLRHWSHWGVPH